MFKLLDPSLTAAAGARLGSVRWRFSIGALFALGAALTLGSAAAGFSWYLAISLAMGFDYLLGKSYLSAQGDKERATAGALFFWGCLFSIGVFAAMPIMLAFNGGGAGRVLGALMVATSLVSLTLCTFKTMPLMLAAAALPTAALLYIPAIPVSPDPATALAGAIGVACGVAGFLAYLGRAALTNMAMMVGWRSALDIAKERQREAEAKLAAAEAAHRARSDLLATMAQELRASVNAVIAYAETVQESLVVEASTEAANDAARIGASARDLLGVVDRIHDLRSMDGGQEAPRRDLNVRKLIEDGVAAAQDEEAANADESDVASRAAGGLRNTP